MDFGRIYVPNACQQSKCHVHFALHGGGRVNQEAKNPEYNRIAADNNIIMIYPQSLVGWNLMNKLGDENYNTQDEMYPRLMMAMINRLAEGCPAEDEDVCLSDSQKSNLRSGLTELGSTLQSRFDTA